MDRFWAKVNKEPGQGPTGTCWLWTAAIDTNGYGAYKIGARKRNAHRVAYELINGPIDRHLDVRHTCDVRLCCNPEHLVRGTRLQNVQDAMDRDRNPKGETNGNSKFSEKQARAVKELLAGGAKCVTIANLVGCSPETIGLIKNGKTWKHVS